MTGASSDRAMHLVQSSVAPTLGLCTEIPLYYRANDFVLHDHRRQCWKLAPGAGIWFNTYFNGLSIRRWKDTSPLGDVAIDIHFRGHVTARLHVMAAGGISTTIDEIELESDRATTVRWPIAAWHEWNDGIVYLSLHALDDSLLERFEFVTSTPPVREVRLGICITHYDRKAEVVPAVARLRRQLLDDPRFADRVGLIVVDNSRNLEPSEVPGATLVPNRNLGGAGGFSRGMMHLNDDGSFTHALFMDDDASCEVESIRRTIALLAHARDERTAIAGAMLLSREPFRQFECGARFDGLCRAMRQGIDLRDPAVLAGNEHPQSADYGSWWYFAFPLTKAIGYPFPFFVRGDDIDFSLRNRFELATANGIASWQEDFAFKHAPQTNYLDTRNHLLQILHGFVGGQALAFYVCLRMFLLPNLSGQYELASAAIMAIGDIRRGPDFFRHNADLAEPRRRLQAITRVERMRPLSSELVRHAEWTGLAETRWRGLLRLVSANGHLLPRVFFHRSAARFDKSYVLPLRGTFLRSRSLVFNDRTGTGMLLEHSKMRFFANLWKFACTTTAFMVGYRGLAAAYREAYPQLTSDAFWRGQFGITATSVERAPSASNARASSGDARSATAAVDAA